MAAIDLNGRYEMSKGLVLITGGGSGMGQLCARNHAASGWEVVILDVNDAGMQKTVEGFETIRALKVDVTSVQQVQDAISSVVSDGKRINKFYNCAAIMPFGRIIDQDVETMARIIDINVKGFIIPSKIVLEHMLEAGSGQFIGFASSAGLMPTLKTGIYSCSKAAVAFFMDVMHHENLNSGIQFVCVCPPAVNTPLLEQGKSTQWTKALEASEPLEPQEVLDEIEKCLKKKEFWCYPGKQTKFAVNFRRLFPGLFWKQIHKIEGE